MKESRTENNKQSKQQHVNLPKPDIRDNLDSRKEKEGRYSENENSNSNKEKSKGNNSKGSR